MAEGFRIIQVIYRIVVVVREIRLQAEPYLPDIALARYQLGCCLGMREVWDQQSDQNGDDRNHHQQFDKSKGVAHRLKWKGRLERTLPRGAESTLVQHIPLHRHISLTRLTASRVEPLKNQGCRYSALSSRHGG